MLLRGCLRIGVVLRFVRLCCCWEDEMFGKWERAVWEGTRKVVVCMEREALVSFSFQVRRHWLASTQRLNLHVVFSLFSICLRCFLVTTWVLWEKWSEKNIVTLLASQGRMERQKTSFDTRSFSRDHFLSRSRES